MQCCGPQMVAVEQGWVHWGTAAGLVASWEGVQESCLHTGCSLGVHYILQAAACTVDSWWLLE